MSCALANVGNARPITNARSLTRRKMVTIFALPSCTGIRLGQVVCLIHFRLPSDPARTSCDRIPPLVKSLLVTGSSGLIGSEVAKYFAELDWRVHGVDNNQRAVFFG